MTLYRFEQISWGTPYTANCRACGRTLRRVLTDFQTLNPVNKNAQGMVKTEKEILAELMARAPKKVAKAQAGAICRSCAKNCDRCGGTRKTVDGEPCTTCKCWHKDCTVYPPVGQKWCDLHQSQCRRCKDAAHA